MAQNNFQYQIRTQFTFTLDAASLAKVLREIAAKKGQHNQLHADEIE